MSRQVALTTIDNPYDPLDDFTAWFLFDDEKGYHSCAYLGRIARTSDSLSDEQNMEEIEKAIDEIIKYDFLNIYKKVVKTDENDEKSSEAGNPEPSTTIS